MVALVLAGCGRSGGDVFTTIPPSTTNDAGEPCTPQSQRNDWPVKIVFVVQNTGAMCIVDGPGSTGTMGFCEQYAPPNLPALAGRYRAIKDFVDANAARTNVSVALVTFGLTPEVIGFGPGADLVPQLAPQQARLTSGSNLPAALGAARSLIDSDAQTLTATVRARTRYAVVLLGTGALYPRCARNDSLPVYASAVNPELVWADSPGAESWCNDPRPNEPEPLGPDAFYPGGDLNQNAQITGAVNRLLALDLQHGLGDIRVHARRVLSESAITACGPICNDVLGPGSLAETKVIADYTLNLVAQTGQGTYANPGEPSSLEVTSIDTSEFTTFCP